MSTAVKKDPKKWEAAKARAKAKMGGKHSARAMQLAVKYYKDSGGTYSGKKKSTNKLSKWTKQKWTTKSGKKSSKTGERYLPERLIKSMSSSQYAYETRKKREATKKGKQKASYSKRTTKRIRRYT